MASIRPHGDGYRVYVKHKGVRETATFRTKREAQAWADARMVELRATSEGTLGRIKTLGDAMFRYADEVSPTHKGDRWERVRLKLMWDMLPVALPLSKITSDHIDAFKAHRLASVSPGSVLRELNLLGSVLAHARRDWKWMSHNPMADVRRPPKPKHRDRVITRSEVRTMCRALGYISGWTPSTKSAMTAYAMLIAIRTGMRAGEIVGMTWANHHGSWAHLPKTKNGFERDVPLSAKASRLIERLRGLDEERVLPLAGSTLDVLFRRAREQSGLDGFVFHDTRHTAATRIGATVGQDGRLSFPEFCLVFGWRDPKYALVYVNPSAARLAAKM